MNDEKNTDLLYGYAEIGAYLSLSAKAVEHLSNAEVEPLPVFNIGRRRCALKSRLDTWLTDKAARSAVEG